MKQAHVSRCTSAFFLVRWTKIVTHTACVTKEPTKKSSVRVLPKRVVNSWSNLDLVHLNGEQKTTHTASINSPLKTDTDIKPSKFSACKWLKTQVPRTILVLLQSTAFRESAAYPIPSAARAPWACLFRHLNTRNYSANYLKSCRGVLAPAICPKRPLP